VYFEVLEGLREILTSDIHPVLHVVLTLVGKFRPGNDAIE
jgi:hypothetical protein